MSITEKNVAEAAGILAQGGGLLFERPFPGQLHADCSDESLSLRTLTQHGLSPERRGSHKFVSTAERRANGTIINTRQETKMEIPA